MYQFIWESSFKRAYKKLVKNNFVLKSKIVASLELLAKDPYYPGLKTHKLHGNLSHLLSAYVDYDYRIIFSVQTIDNVPSIVLVDIGTHEEVY